MGSRVSVVQSAPAKELGSSSRFNRRRPASLGIVSGLPPPRRSVSLCSVGFPVAIPRVHRQASRVLASTLEVTGRDGNVPKLLLDPLRSCLFRRPWIHHVSNPTTDGSFEPAQAALVLRSDGFFVLSVRASSLVQTSSGLPPETSSPDLRSVPATRMVHRTARRLRVRLPSSISDVRGLRVGVRFVDTKPLAHCVG
jgi:hypothetical protein